MLEKTEGAIRNGQANDIGYTRHRTKTKKKQKTKLKRWATQAPPKKKQVWPLPVQYKIYKNTLLNDFTDYYSYESGCERLNIKP